MVVAAINAHMSQEPELDGGGKHRVPVSRIDFRFGASGEVGVSIKAVVVAELANSSTRNRFIGQGAILLVRRRDQDITDPNVTDPLLRGAGHPLGWSSIAKYASSPVGVRSGRGLGVSGQTRVRLPFTIVGGGPDNLHHACG